MKGSRTGYYLLPQRVKCSSMWGVPLLVSGIVLNIIAKQLFWSAQFKCKNFDFVIVCSKWKASTLKSGQSSFFSRRKLWKESPTWALLWKWAKIFWLHPLANSLLFNLNISFYFSLKIISLQNNSSYKNLSKLQALITKMSVEKKNLSFFEPLNGFNQCFGNLVADFTLQISNIIVINCGHLWDLLSSISYSEML